MENEKTNQAQQQKLNKILRDMTQYGWIFFLLAIFLIIGIITPFLGAIQKDIPVSISLKVILTITLTTLSAIACFVISFGFLKRTKWLLRIVYGCYILFAIHAILIQFFGFNLNYLIIGTQPKLIYRIVMSLFILIGYPYAVMLPFTPRIQRKKEPTTPKTEGFQKKD